MEKSDDVKRINSLLLLRKSLATLNETEKVASSTLTELVVQKDTIKKINKNLENSDQELEKSNSLLRKMMSFFRR